MQKRKITNIVFAAIGIFFVLIGIIIIVATVNKERLEL